MGFLVVLPLLLALAACAGAGATAADDAAPPVGIFARQQQVDRDVQAILQGMSAARAKADAVARARTP